MSRWGVGPKTFVPSLAYTLAAWGATRPMSLADACLVRLSELEGAGEIFTLDPDFRVHRRHGNKVISVLMPD
jgi:hypothetical protein